MIQAHHVEESRIVPSADEGCGELQRIGRAKGMDAKQTLGERP